MARRPPESLSRWYVEELLRVSLALGEVAASLIEDLPETAFPGEDVAEVVVELLTGTIQPACAGVGERAMQETIALLGASYDRVVADLEELERRTTRR